MSTRTESVKGQIVGAAVTNTAELLGFSRATISRTMTEFKIKQGKTSSNRRNPGRTYKLTDKDRRASQRIVGRNHRTTAARVPAELNQYSNSTVSTKTVRRELYKAGYRGRTAIRKPLLECSFSFFSAAGSPQNLTTLTAFFLQ